jgi:2-polyprenyl-6-hydroxyphenyl methylase/3-demethylubiquinone-9 3-methyltransferase
MTSGLQAICARYEQCKCCGAPAAPYGVVDFHKNCEIYRRRVLDVSGVPIYYHRCPSCQFIFTTAFDHFTKADFLEHIYNDEYLLVDPDYREARARGNADTLCRLFPVDRPRNILDYGGGNGVLAESLRAAGFPEVETYDPFVPRHSARPADRFDCVVCFEVVEHATDPLHVFAEMNDLLTDSGLIVFSTLLQPIDMEEKGLNWWYAGPRNGHVSLFSRTGLERLVRRFGFQFGSFDENLHVLFREIPDFARHFIRPAPSFTEALCTSEVPDYY